MYPSRIDGYGPTRHPKRTGQLTRLTLDETRAHETDGCGVTTSLALAEGYHGPPPLTLGTVLGQWTPDPATLLVVLLLGGGYLCAVRRSPTPWRRAHLIAFGAGLALILLVGVSFIGVYADTLFWVRATQVIILLMVAPLCLALGSPVALLTEALPGRLDRTLGSRFARFLTFPATASLLLVATPWAFYFTGWYSAVLGNGLVDRLSRLALLLVGFLYFYSRLQLDPVPRRYPHLISVVITFVEVIFDAALGLVLWLNPHIVAEGYYHAVGRNWGPSLRTDQIIGAGVLWLVGDLAGLPFLGALMNRMRVDDAREAAEIDRQLDEQEAAADSPAPTRLWWEDDPVLAERFRRNRPS